MPEHDARDYVLTRERWHHSPLDAPFTAAQDSLAAAVAARKLRHGELPTWRAVLTALEASNKPSLTIDAGVVVVGEDAIAEGVQREHLRDQLMQLRPWRKGPFAIAGITIDTEWRSDWKWDRVLPALSSLEGRHVLDVGCGSGYHLWRMREAGASSVLGIEPMLLYQHQFDVVQHFAKDPNVQCLPLALEHVPADLPRFDTVFSMGVLYHAKAPVQHLEALHQRLHSGGECLLETLVLNTEEAARQAMEIPIPDRYARMRNIHRLPSTRRVLQWMENAGFSEVRLVRQDQTSTDEQRSTEWMPFESLKQSLNPENLCLTIEGLPAPCRAIFVAKKPE